VSVPSRRLRGGLEPPDADEIAAICAREGIGLAAGEAEALAPSVAAVIAAADAAEGLRTQARPLRWTDRDPGHLPGPGEDPLNVFTRICRVTGAQHGPLAGMTVAVKDNISVAGVPTTNGSRLTPHVPTLDAAVVERILAAGGSIVGKLNMDDFGTAGTGESSAFGPPRNPVDTSRSAGGSSGGSGAAVRAGAVDLALAVDQGGSGRIPAAFCGVVAIKATHGLVPSFGVTHIDHTLDHVTPVAPTVARAALLLEAVAGADDRDPQWVRGPIPSAPSADAAAEGVRGMRVGLVAESREPDGGCQQAVLDGLAGAEAALRAAGAEVSEVSIPIWARALRIFQPYIACLAAQMVRSEGEGYGHLGWIDVERMRAFAAARRAQSADLPPQLKCWMVAERWMHERYLNVPYGVLQNLRLLVRRQVSEALGELDVLLTPTVPTAAPPLLGGPVPPEELIERTAASLCFNTAPLNLTGHPAVTVPSGADADGLPTAVQLVAAHWDERSAIRAAAAVEAAG
jgi:amidase